MKKLVVLTSIALFALTGTAAAQQPARVNSSVDGKSGFWEWERVVEELTLTEEETGNLTELGKAHLEKNRQLRGEIKTER